MKKANSGIEQETILLTQQEVLSNIASKYLATQQKNFLKSSVKAIDTINQTWNSDSMTVTLNHRNAKGELIKTETKSIEDKKVFCDVNSDAILSALAPEDKTFIKAKIINRIKRNVRNFYM